MTNVPTSESPSRTVYTIPMDCLRFQGANLGVAVGCGVRVSRLSPNRGTQRMNQIMNDVVLECKDCGRSFTFTKGEQEFYAMKGLSQPTRCPDCRRLRKQQKQSMQSDRSYYSDPQPRRKEVFDVVCESCGRQTTVPFKPTGRKPVLCRDCYNKQNGIPTNNGGGGGGWRD